MKKFLYCCLILFLFLILGCKQTNNSPKIPKIVQGVLDLQSWDFSKDGLVNLDGEWEFYWGEFCGDHLKFSGDARQCVPTRIGDKGKNYIPVPGNWNNYIHDGKPIGGKGFATYRLKVLLPSIPTARTYDRMSLLGIKIQQIGSAYNLYINGKLYGTGGKVSTNENSAKHGMNYELYLINQDDVLSLPSEKNTKILNIQIEVSNYHRKVAGIWYPINFGNYNTLLRKDFQNAALDFFLFGSIFIMGLYHLGLYTLRKKDPSALWFGIYCLMITFRILLTGEKYLERLLPDASLFLVFLEYFQLVLLVPAFVNFLYYLFLDEFSNRIRKGFVYIGCFFTLPILILPSFYYTRILLTVQVYMVLAGLYATYVLIAAILHKKQGSKTFLLGWLLFFVTIINDILYAQLIIDTAYIVPFGLFAFILSQAAVLSMRFSSAFSTSEKLSEELDHSLKTIAEKENQYKTLMESISVGVYRNTGGAKGGFIQANPAIAKIFGYETVDEFMKIHVSELYENPEERKKFVEMMQKSGECKNVELKLKKKNGTPFWANCSAKVHYDSDSTILWMDGTIEDITELKNATDELISLSENLENKVVERTKDLNNAKSEIEALNHFTYLINSLSNLNDIFIEISKYFKEKYNISGTWLFLPDKKKENLYAYKSYSYNKLPQEQYDFLMNLKVPLKEEGGTLYLTYKRKKPLHLPKIKFFKFETDKLIVDITRAKSFIHVPLLSKGECIGIYAFSNLTEEMKLSKRETNSIANLCSQISGVIETTHLLETVDKTKQEIEIARKKTEDLNALLKRLNESTDLKKIMEIVGDYVKEKFHFPYYSLSVLNEKENKLDFRHGRYPEHLNIEEIKFIQKWNIPLDLKDPNSFHSKALEKQKPLFIPDTNAIQTETGKIMVKILQHKCFLTLPIFLENSPIGTLDLLSLEKVELQNSDITELSLLSEQLAGIVNSSLLYAQIQEEKEKVEKAKLEVDKLNEFTKKINSISSIDTILEEIFQFTVSNFKIDFGFIQLKDGDVLKTKKIGNYSNVLSTEELEFVSNLVVSLNKSGGVPYRTYIKKKPIFMPASYFDKLFIKEYSGIEFDKVLIQKIRLKAYLIVPLIIQNEVIGLAYFTSHNSDFNLTKEEVKRIEGFCNQIAGVIHNAQLLKETEESKGIATIEKEKALAAQAETEKQRQEVEQLNQFLKKLNERHILKDVINDISSYLKEVLDLPGLWYWEYNEKEGGIYLKDIFFYGTDIREEFLNKEFFKDPISFKEKKGIHYMAYKKEDYLYIPKLKTRPIGNPVEDRNQSILKMASILIVPLIVQDKLIGMIDISNGHKKLSLKKDTLERTSIFFKQVAGVIQNISLMEKVEKEHNKSEKLLLNILPKDVAEELKEKGAAEPVLFESVSVMFTDFKGFTQIAEHLSPQELVKDLDTCFVQFDKITERFNLEKLKTIGDSYMCAGGIPKRNTTHAMDCILAALEIQSFMNMMKTLKEKKGSPYWELRLGIHSGPLVAGVIGEKKFAYDVWGDTVNTASRMESSGTPGKINISGSTYNLVKEFFECEYRGQVNAKNKGLVDMYYVNGLKPEYSKKGDGKMPNGKFWELYGMGF